jgi:hypothetical protein
LHCVLLHLKQTMPLGLFYAAFPHWFLCHPYKRAASCCLVVLMLRSMIAEHCATTGDVGRPASHLRTRFPGLVSAMSDLQEVWWFNPAPDDHPNCALTG